MYWLGEEKLLVDHKGCNKCYRSELRNTRTRKYFIFNWIDVWMINVNFKRVRIISKARNHWSPSDNSDTSKHLSLFQNRAKNFTIFVILFIHAMLSTWLILAVCRMGVTHEPNNGLTHHRVICCTEVEHRRVRSERPRFNSSRKLRTFSLFHPQDQRITLLSNPYFLNN